MYLALFKLQNAVIMRHNVWYVAFLLPVFVHWQSYRENGLCRSSVIRYTWIPSLTDCTLCPLPIWKALRSKGMPDSILHLITALRENTGARIRVGLKLSSRISSTSGVRQCRILAPSWNVQLYRRYSWRFKQCSVISEISNRKFLLQIHSQNNQTYRTL